MSANRFTLFDSSPRPTRRAFGRTFVNAVAAAALLVTTPLRDLFAADATGPADEPSLSNSSLEYAEQDPYRLHVELKVAAPHDALREVKAVCPCPIDWPEQKVKLLEEHRSPGVRVKETAIKQMGAMMTLSIGEIRRGAEASVERTYEIARSTVTFTRDRGELRRPDARAKELEDHLGADPGIDPKDPQIAKLQKSLRPADHDAWTSARAYYDWIRRNIEFELGDYRGAALTLEKQVGDCEDMTALFLALCRADGIPARTVWIEAHAYAEFYLQRPKDKGWWIPAQLAGNRWFGEMREQRVILQKGDSIMNPITGKAARYIPHTCIATGGMPALTCERTLVEP